MSKNKLRHIAIILDGNKRWADKKKISRSEGYEAGFNKILEIANHSIKLNVSDLTLFTLSSENYYRKSISIIYDLIYKNFDDFINKIIEKKNIKINIFGNRNNLPDNIIEIFKKCEKSTFENKTLNLNLAFNYGFKDEIRKVLFKYIKNHKNTNINDINNINDLFYLKNKPDPDILIRTGGYKRLSNFIMYNLTYTELFFTDTLWPDFTKEELEKFVNDFYKVDRKYGL